MFTLRRISGEGIEMNQFLGQSYTHISRECNYDEFCRCFEKVFSRSHVADLDETSDKNTKDCYAFICNTTELQPLYKNQKNFIMSDSGKTFDNLTYR